jgi:hypothetical protein
MRILRIRFRIRIPNTGKLDRSFFFTCSKINNFNFVIFVVWLQNKVEQQIFFRILKQLPYLQHALHLTNILKLLRHTEQYFNWEIPGLNCDKNDLGSAE